MNNNTLDNIFGWTLALVGSSMYLSANPWLTFQNTAPALIGSRCESAFEGKRTVEARNLPAASYSAKASEIIVELPVRSIVDYAHPKTFCRYFCDGAAFFNYSTDEQNGLGLYADRFELPLVFTDNLSLANILKSELASSSSIRLSLELAIGQTKAWKVNAVQINGHAYCVQ